MCKHSNHHLLSHAHLPFKLDHNVTFICSKFIGEAAESHELCCTDVRVVCGQGFHTSGSSKLAYKNLVEYNWEPRYYTGQLIAVHCLGRFYAYGLKSKHPDRKLFN